MWYGLAKKPDWYAERIERFVALAATPIIMEFCGEYEEEVKRF